MLLLCQSNKNIKCISYYSSNYNENGFNKSYKFNNKTKTKFTLLIFHFCTLLLLALGILDTFLEILDQFLSYYRDVT